MRQEREKREELIERAKHQIARLTKALVVQEQVKNDLAERTEVELRVATCLFEELRRMLGDREQSLKQELILQKEKKTQLLIKQSTECSAELEMLQGLINSSDVQHDDTRGDNFDELTEYFGRFDRDETAPVIPVETSYPEIAFDGELEIPPALKSMRIQGAVSVATRQSLKALSETVAYGSIRKPRRIIGSLGEKTGCFSFPRGLVVNQKDNVIVSDSSNHRIQIFDQEGACVRSIGSRGPSDGQFNYPAGIAVDQQDNILVCDHGNNRVQKFDSKGRHIFSIGSHDDQTFDGPYGVAIDNENNILVCENGGNQVQVFDREGNFLFKFGSKGADDGQFNKPRGIVLNQKNQIIVADSGNHRIQIFDNKGQHITTKYGEKNQPLYGAQGVTVDHHDNIVLCGEYSHQIQVLDESASKTLQIFGKAGNLASQFLRPWSIAFDSHNRMLICDWANHRVQLF